MFHLIAGLLLFLGVHSIVIFAPDLRARYRQKNLLAWKAVYGIISIAGFVLIIIGYGQARGLTSGFIYLPPDWLEYPAFILMLPASILFFAPYFPGRISRIIRHPQLFAVQLLAIAHLLTSGTFANLVLFGSILIWAVADTIALNRLADDNPPNRPPQLKESRFNDVLLLTLGIGVYIGFIITFHDKLIGVPLSI